MLIALRRFDDVPARDARGGDADGLEVRSGAEHPRASSAPRTRSAGAYAQAGDIAHDEITSVWSWTRSVTTIA